MMTTTVYFDLDGTLLEYTSSFQHIVDQTLPVPASTEMVDYFSEQVLLEFSRVSQTPYELAFEALCDQYDIDADPVALTNEQIENEADATRIDPSVKQLLEHIATHHQTGILTNGDGRMQRRKIGAHGLDEIVDVILVANELGSSKPSLANFEHAKERLPAEIYIHVGDSYEEDIVPARNAGFIIAYVGETHHPDVPVATSDMKHLAAFLMPLIGH